MILERDIIFANNNCYLTFEELSQGKDHCTSLDFIEAHKSFGAEGVSEFFAEISRIKVYKKNWLNYIKGDNPYGLDPKAKLSLSWQNRLLIKRDQTERVFEDDQILIIRPLTYESMVLYGYETKWCYASASTDEHYRDVEDRSTFYIIFNKKNKNKMFYKFLLTINKPTGVWIFDDQTNRTLTRGKTFNKNMKKTDENSLRQIDFLFDNKEAIKSIK